ncbi:MAG: EF-Tu/IF-2/RF-3 family GTPase [Candidatus Micrarchaeaceae archaeon]
MNTIVAIPLDDGIADYIGKKGSENSITFYNRKLNDSVIVALMPSSIEEKFYALPQSLLMADQIVVSTRDVDRLFGEVLVACALLDKKVIFTKDSDISKMLSGTAIGDISFADRENILDMIVSLKKDANEGENARIDIDKAFNVKGVGTVVLGIVTKGTVRVHDVLYHSSGKPITVRSIQSQDEDIKEAGPGTRVGIAVKGMDESEIEKGDTLSSSAIKPSKTLEISIRGSSFANETIENGKMYSIAIGFSYAIATIEKVEGANATVKLEKAIPAEIGDTLMMARAAAPRIFASGKVLKAD